MQVVPDSCACREEPDSCIVTFIHNRPKQTHKPSKVHILKAEEDDDRRLHFENIALFGRNGFAGHRLHPEHDDSGEVEVVSSKLWHSNLIPQKRERGLAKGFERRL